MDKHEWLMYMLKAMNKVTDDDIDVIMQQFDALDCDGSGYLDMDDLKNASNLGGGAPLAGGRRQTVSFLGEGRWASEQEP